MRLLAVQELQHRLARAQVGRVVRQLETGLEYERFVPDDLRALAASLNIPFDLV